MVTLLSTYVTNSMLCVVLLQALDKLLHASNSTASRQQLLDAMSGNLQQFWPLMSNQVVAETVKFEEGREFTTVGGEKITVKKDPATG
jgi:hypothetical protein